MIDSGFDLGEEKEMSPARVLFTKAEKKFIDSDEYAREEITKALVGTIGKGCPYYTHIWNAYFNLLQIFRSVLSGQDSLVLTMSIDGNLKEKVELLIEYNESKIKKEISITD